jgi:hypothetical protein
MALAIDIRSRGAIIKSDEDDRTVFRAIDRRVTLHRVCVDLVVDTPARKTGQCADDEVEDDSPPNGQRPDGLNAAKESPD